MTLGPILPGRLPASLASNQLQRHLTLNNRVFLQLQEQLATGQKFFLPSESPAAASRTLVLQKTLERKAQMQANIGADRSLLAVSETALASVSDVLNAAQAFAIAGVGQLSTPAEKQAMALEVDSLIRSALNTANTKHAGRYLFGGSETLTQPFTWTGTGPIRYNGNLQSIESFIDLNSLLGNNVDGQSAFGAMTAPVGGDVNPALTLDSRIADLHGGAGFPMGGVVVTLDDGVAPQTQTVDLSGAKTIGDVKRLLENAFAGGPLTLDVDIDPATNHGLRLTPSVGTITVANVEGSRVASDLGIAGAGLAQIDGADLNPRLTLTTRLDALNGGAGIGPTAGNGLLIAHGSKTAVVDLSSAVTIEDVFNLLKQADLDLYVGINAAGNGLAVSSRLSGVSFSIGEHNGENAAGLGLRTFTADTLLSELNFNTGVPVDEGTPLVIHRRDGTTEEIDLSGAKTVGDVLDRINAVDPGVLTAALNAVGNGVTLLDGSGAGPLEAAENNVSLALGIAGLDESGDPSVALVGDDVNRREPPGVFQSLLTLAEALRNGDDRELERVSRAIAQETERFNLVRGDLGSRLKVLDDVENRLLDDDLRIQETLTEVFHADIAEVMTQLVFNQQALEATLRTAAQTMHLNLFAFL